MVPKRLGCPQLLIAVASIFAALTPCLASRLLMYDDGQLNMSLWTDAWDLDGSVDFDPGGRDPLRSSCPEVVQSQSGTIASLDMVALSDAVRTTNCRTRQRTGKAVPICAMPRLPEAEMAQFASGSHDVLNSAVLNANRDFFKMFIDVRSETVWLIEFYTDGCLRCKTFAAQWVRFGVALKEAQSRVQPVSVNCEVHAGLCRRHGVRAFPRLEVSYRGHSQAVSTALGVYNNIKESSYVEGQQHIYCANGLGCPAPPGLKGLARGVREHRGDRARCGRLGQTPAGVGGGYVSTRQGHARRLARHRLAP